MNSARQSPSPDSVREWLVETVATYLQCAPSSISTSQLLSEYGLDSVYSLTVCADIEDRFNLVLDPTIMWDYPTIDALTRVLASMLETSVSGTGTVSPPAAPGRSLSNEALALKAVLPDDIAPQAGAKPASEAPYQTILLTGATGFAGAFLLREILNRSSARVYVLVRATDAGAACERVKSNSSEYGLWREGDRVRLVGVPGDLALPRFGLTDALYTELEENVEVIFHNGAAVNFVLPYERLEGINVAGTQEVLRLACRSRIKPVHLVSSMGVFPERAGKEHFAEAALTTPRGVQGGYRQSKWVADRMVSIAGERGLPVCIYRPGNIVGAYTDGVCTTESIINSFIKGCIQLGSAMDLNIPLLLVPVDFCASAIAFVGLSGARHGSVFHLPGAGTVNWNVFVSMLVEYGYAIRRVPYPEWYARLSSTDAHDNALRAYLPLFDSTALSADLGVADSDPDIATGAMTSALASSGIECPKVDQRLLGIYLDYLVSTGYLPAPARAGHISTVAAAAPADIRA